jgi:LPXTG-site transpeptidase (sortase) family protein
MRVPADISEVGWYRHGPVPGEAGSAVLAAHVDKASEGPGIFFDLDRLVVGDLIEVTFSDASRQTFAVASAESVAKDRLDVDSLFASDGAAVVRLVTCGGAFNHTEGSYVDNVVITAAEVEP